MRFSPTVPVARAGREGLLETRVDVAIIGAGTAGLSALSEVQAVTDRFVVIDGGPLGTTCARVGCMPSKVLVQIAEDYHRRHAFDRQGIGGGNALSLDVPAALRHVRSLRDRFVASVLDGAIHHLGDKLIRGSAAFVEPTLLAVGDQRIRAEAVVIATGSRPALPKFLRGAEDRLLTTDTLFEQADLPGRIAVVGLGGIGLELGQALSRFGISVTGFDIARTVGGLSDPEVSAQAVDILGQEMQMHLGVDTEVENESNALRIRARSGEIDLRADKLLASVGRSPNVEALKLERLGLPLHDDGLPPFDRETMRVGDLPVFFAGDVDGDRPILHEAADEGRIAGRNAVAGRADRSRRKTPLTIAFCEPNICVVGQAWEKVKDVHPAIGSARFDSGRALIQQRTAGLLRLYADAGTGALLGAEMVAPAGEHLAHLLAWAIEQNRGIFDLLDHPFYHPTIEETLKAALTEAAERVDGAAHGREALSR